jgi:hypothetical protein
MAKTVRVFLTCDLHKETDQTEGMASIAFGYDGKLLELDVCREHFDEFNESISPWATAARPYGRFGGPQDEGESKGRGRRVGAGTRSPSNREQLAAIRDWARSNGIDVSERGRIPSSVVEAFEKANP